MSHKQFGQSVTQNVAGGATERPEKSDTDKETFKEGIDKQVAVRGQQHLLSSDVDFIQGGDASGCAEEVTRRRKRGKGGRWWRRRAGRTWCACTLQRLTTSLPYSETGDVSTTENKHTHTGPQAHTQKELCLLPGFTPTEDGGNKQHDETQHSCSISWKSEGRQLAMCKLHPYTPPRPGKANIKSLFICLLQIYAIKNKKMKKQTDLL